MLVWGGSRVAVRVSPSGKFGGIFDSDPAATFTYFAGQLNRYKLAYLHVIEPRIKGIEEIEQSAPPVAATMLRRIFHGPLIAAGGFDRRSAEAIIDAGTADLVAFGRAFISNPDLPERFRHKLPLAPYDRATFYGGDHRGYVDYPPYNDVLADDVAVLHPPKKEQTMSSLPEKLAAFRANFEAGGPPYNAPAAIQEPMHRATAELIASHAAAKALKVGDRAPSFTLKDPDGHEVTSKDLLAQGPLVVTFYRGVWCPYCNMDLQAMQEALPDIVKSGAKLIAISPQIAVNSRRSQRDNKLTFPILSDPGNEIAAAFGLRFKLPDYLQDLYKNAFKNDLAVANGEPSWTLPMPARFIIGQDSIIRYAEVNPDYTTRPDPSELLPVLDKTAALAA